MLLAGLGADLAHQPDGLLLLLLRVPTRRRRLDCFFDGCDEPIALILIQRSRASTDPRAVQNTACGTTPTASDTFAYNANGQMSTRTVSGSTSTLQWDPLGRLAWSTPGTSTNSYSNPPTGATRYVYDPSGQRMARVSPDGSRTVYLENLEVRSTPATNQGGGTGSTTVRTWGFEGGTTEGFADWYNTTGVDNPATGAQPRTGSRSLKVTAGNQFWGISDNTTTTVTGGTSYTFTAYAKHGDAGPATGVTALIRWYDNLSQGLGETVVGVQTAVTGTWTLISGNTVTSPAAATKAQIEFTSDTSSTGRIYYLDDLSLLTQTGGSSGGGTGGTTIKDWQFETAAGTDGLAPWYGIDTTTPGATEVSTTQAHAGTKSWKLTATGANWAIQDTPWPGRTITAGTTYTFTAWAKAASASGTCQLQIKVAWIDANGQQIGTDMPIGTATSDNATTWTQLTGSATAPTTPTPAVRAVIRVSTSNSANNQVHYLDDIAITTGGNPAPPSSVPLVSYSRYYTIGGATIAMRRGDPTSQTLTWLAGNLQGSLTIANASGTNTINRQRYLPYGGIRGGTDQVATTDKGFLGQVEEAGDLSYLNARYFDRSLGRFLSIDPLSSVDNPQRLNAYVYANNNPLTLSDPSGLEPHLPGAIGRCEDGTGPCAKQAGPPAPPTTTKPQIKIRNEWYQWAAALDTEGYDEIDGLLLAERSKVLDYYTNLGSGIPLQACYRALCFGMEDPYGIDVELRKVEGRLLTIRWEYDKDGHATARYYEERRGEFQLLIVKENAQTFLSVKGLPGPDTGPGVGPNKVIPDNVVLSKDEYRYYIKQVRNDGTFAAPTGPFMYDKSKAIRLGVG